MKPSSWSDLVEKYKSTNIEFNHLKAITLAQWWLESGKGESELAREHLNFGGLKFRNELLGLATPVRYVAHDGEDVYCKFASVEDFIKGYWKFLDRAPYKGWRGEGISSDPIKFIKFIGKTYTPSVGYADKVIGILPFTSPNFPDVVVPVPAPKPPVETFLRLTRTKNTYPSGHQVLKLALVQKGGDWLEVDSVFVKSGAAGLQQFELAAVAVPRSYKPIPEAYYKMGAADWADGVNNWRASWGPGLGPLWFRINKLTPGQSLRDDFGIHLDPEADGTAGCIGCQDAETLKKILSWNIAGKILTVNWELDSVETVPEAITWNPQLHPVKPPSPPVVRPTKKVMLEIGHGPWKDGNGNTGYEEGAYNAFLKRSEYKSTKTYIAPLIKKTLEGRGISVTIMDSQDTLIGLGQAGSGYDAFVSLHLNAFNDSAQGSETLLLSNARPADIKLANYIQKNVVRTLKLNNRGVKYQGLSVLRGASSTYTSNPPLAACLVEPFFVDAVRENSDFDMYLSQAAAGIAEGILDFFGMGMDPGVV